jgi:DNA polymerase, archaea type
LATTNREYVPGAEVWSIYQSDPERIRRYAEDDVREVDGLSRHLMPGVFDLCRMLPRAYESLASDTSPTSLWEPLMVRAYLQSGRAIPAPLARDQHLEATGRAESLLTGVVGAGTRARLPSLVPSVIVERALCAANDDLCVMPSLLRGMRGAVGDRSAAMLEEAATRYLAGQGLFSDPAAAARAAATARQYVQRLANDMRALGCSIVEIQADQVLVGTPPAWNGRTEDAARERAATYLPSGVRLTFEGPYAVVYARGGQRGMFMADDGSITLVGSTVRPGRMERFGESFVRRAAERALSGDVLGMRQVFLDTLYGLQTAQVAIEDLCVHVTLHKSPHEYRRLGAGEEPYEALLGAGIRSWRPGQRVRYFRSVSGAPRLYREGEAVSAAEADTAYYVRRLTGLYCQQFAQAFTREDYGRVFGVPSQPGPWVAEPELGAVRTIVTPAPH